MSNPIGFIIFKDGAHTLLISEAMSWPVFGPSPLCKVPKSCIPEQGGTTLNLLAVSTMLSPSLSTCESHRGTGNDLGYFPILRLAEVLPQLAQWSSQFLCYPHLRLLLSAVSWSRLQRESATTTHALASSTSALFCNGGKFTMNMSMRV